MPSRCAPSRRVVSKTWKASPSGDTCNNSVRCAVAVIIRYSWSRAGSVLDGRRALLVLTGLDQWRASAGGQRRQSVADGGGLSGGPRLPGGQVESHRGLDPAGRVRQSQVIEQQSDREHGGGGI